MKLRFVKFLTSRENEIEKKEEGGRSTALACSVIPQPGRGRSSRFRLSPPSLHYFHPLSLHPALPARDSPPQLALRHGSGEQDSPATPPPAVLLLPSFFIKLPKQKSVEGRTVAGAQLAGPAVTGRAQLAAPLHPHSIGWPAASLRFQWHPLCGGWSHRKTKTENEVPCFVSFIDE